MPSGSKISTRAHLEQVWKSTGKKPQQLKDLPEPPRELIYLWEWYCEMAVGDSSLTFTEIRSWSELHGIALTINEVSLLRKLDTTHRSG